MDSLLLTLGHGSSAIYVKDGVIMDGYQNERISRAKSDSRFPLMAIEEITRRNDVPKNVDIFVSHWHPTGNVDSNTPKHWNKHALEILFPHSEITGTRLGFSHHDAHAWSAIAYNNKAQGHILVMDGFGNFGEVLSLYYISDGTPVLVHRTFGYESSLGLLYQYATDFVDLRMNQDEWKLNAKATQVKDADRERVYNLAQEYSLRLIGDHLDKVFIPKADPVIEIGALSMIHKEVHDFLSKHFPDKHRGNIAFFLQNTIEMFLQQFLDAYGVEDLTVVGGCFLNVQLNGFLSQAIKGKFCAMPLSGDEGAALGMLRANQPFEIPDDLCWGSRSLNFEGGHVDRLMYTKDVAKDLPKLLAANLIVNVVRGKMEYGPRAYCNTSTLALPTKENSDYINMVNNRDIDMPMCPVMSDILADELFLDGQNVIRSKEHMIMALRYKERYPGLEGVTHTDLRGDPTGRPQVISPDHYMYPVVSTFGPLINTSFNNHGEPICWNYRSIVKAHLTMSKRDVDNRIVTLIEN